MNSLDINFSYSLFKLYNGFNISENEIFYEFTGNLVNFNIMNENTGIGIDISPVRYFYSSQSNILSFVNIYLYWDIFRIIKPYNGTVRFDCPELGPFVSINWINIDDIAPFNINRIIFSAGLKHSWGIRWPINKFRPIYKKNNHTYIDIETGYRNIYGKHNFFLSIQFNLVYFLERMAGA
ncbi:MAG: hypothetical protein LBU85_01540 [Treponema sp.]|jgi:hypothetical protein|nr:hypothetical protein [Treponema sp.]